MFGKLKEKLKGWFKTSTEKVEKTAEVVEKPEKPEEIVKPKKEKIKKKKKEEKKKEVLEKDIKEADEIIEKAKLEEGKEVPVKFEVGKQKYEPDLEKIKEKKIEIEKENRMGDESPLTNPPSLVKSEKKSFFSRLKSTFSYKIGEKEFNQIFDDLEMLLLENNVALEVVEDLRKRLSDKLIGKEIQKDELESEIKDELKSSLNEILIEPDNPLEIIKDKDKKPFIILFFGVNGTGKTTSIAKIAYFLKKSGISVVLAAGDTFRAASIEQISEHAKKLNIPLIKHGYEADPAAVGFDAIKYAKSHGIDVVLIDTAGRMHTKTNLMSEMEKICRVTNPNLKIFVAESIAGNDAVEQARTFQESIGIDGSILSKADVDDKGGTIISVSYATHKPIFYLGIGQNYEDLRLFNKQEFIEELLG